MRSVFDVAADHANPGDAPRGGHAGHGPFGIVSRLDDRAEIGVQTLDRVTRAGVLGKPGCFVMHHLGAMLRKLVHLFERGAIDHVRGRNATRIGGHRAAYVGVDVNAIRAQCVTDRDRREVGPTAAQRRDRAVFGRPLKAGDHRDRAALEQRAYRMGVDP